MTEISKPVPVDPMKNLQPGEQISVEGKEALAKANAAETENAHKLAADRRAQDAQNEPPLIRSLQDSIKGKLEELPPQEGAPQE